MTNPEANPDTHVCVDGGLPGPWAEREGGAAVELITARDVPLGGPRAMNVRRTLPQRQRSLIGDDCLIGTTVWIGSNVTVLPGVTIGDNAVVAAASVLTRDVSAAGSPPRTISPMTATAPGKGIPVLKGRAFNPHG